MDFKLVVVAGEAKQSELALSTPAIIGRSRNADITLGHPLVSRRHCEITEGDDSLLVVEDLGSLNGTMVGDTRIGEPVYLEPGDLLTVGEVTFRAVYGDYTTEDAKSDVAVLPDFSALGKQKAAETPQFIPEETVPAQDDAAEVVEFETFDEAEPAEEVAEYEEVEMAEAEPVEEVDMAAAEPVEEIAEAAEEAEEVKEERAQPAESGDQSGFDFAWLDPEDKQEASSSGSGKKSGGDDDLDSFLKKI